LIQIRETNEQLIIRIEEYNELRTSLSGQDSGNLNERKEIEMFET
jgi:hypothetical protein